MNNDGGPAFPTYDDVEYEREGGNSAHALEMKTRGMSLRDWFAGHALVAYAGFGVTNDTNDKIIAKWCFGMADAMLAERERKPE